MTKEQAEQLLDRISYDYDQIENPKYRNANPSDLKENLETLVALKEYLGDKRLYHNLINAISQIIKRIDQYVHPDRTRRTITDRGINKAIQPVINKKGHPVIYPFEWQYQKSDYTCCITEGTWDENNFKVMDMIGYKFLLNEGDNSLPKKSSSIFEDIESIETREMIQSKELYDQPSFSTNSNIDRIMGSKYWISFSDADFRKFTYLDSYSSNDIKDLIHLTSRVEFRICYPVRMMGEGRSVEKKYQMNIYSRFFEFGHLDKDIRYDGIVQRREYYICFNTLLGELFIHNLLMKNYDWVDQNFYTLPSNAQLFYRQFIIHHNYPSLNLNLDTIKKRLHLYDQNITNLIKTIEGSIFKPLIINQLILSFDRIDNGQIGIKYLIHLPTKGSQKQ